MQGKEDCIHRIIILRIQEESREDYNHEHRFGTKLGKGEIVSHPGTWPLT